MNNGSIKRIDELGRIVIPKDIRKRLSIKANDSLEVSIDNNTIKISKSKAINNFDDFIIKLLKIIDQNFNYTLIATNRDNIIFNNKNIDIDIKKIFSGELDNYNLSYKPIIIDSNIEGFILLGNSNCNEEIIKVINSILMNYSDITC